jgi:hypothetical protein
MARNSQTFEIGNHAARAGLKLTPEIHELFVNTVRQTGRLSIAAGRCCVSPTTVRDWLRKGRIENAEPIFKQFADDVEKSRAEYLAIAARRMGQLAIGGSLMLPKFDRSNNPIRDENGEIVLEEKYFPPDQRALAHILDRIDPEPNLAPQQPGIPEEPERLTSAEQIAEAAKYFSLYREGVQILIDLGVPPRHIAAPRDIETTAVHPEPASLQDNVSTTEKPAASVSDNATDTEKPAPPKIDVPDAF